MSRISLFLPFFVVSAALAAEPAPIVPGDWPAHRAELRAAWEKVLGKFPAERAPLAVQREAAEDFPAYTRQKVSYAIEDGVREDAVLFVPKPVPAKAPAIVVFHPTLKEHYAQVAGYDTSNPDKLMGPQLAERGYIVLCPRCFIFDDGADYKGNVAKMQARHPDWLGITRMTWDGIRAVDFLASLPNVDNARIGTIGHSLGAKEALYAAAFDERVKASVSCEGGVGLALSNWHDVWYLGPFIKEPGFARDQHELLALAAPRAFLLIGGGSADGDPSVPFVDAARPVFKALGAEKALRFFNHGQGHKYPPAARAVAEPFLDEYLRK
jgi:dienelactone hydrolase